MSLALQLDKVSWVLLANEWYEVYQQSFSLDSYEYLWEEQIIHGGGQSGLCAIGFMFEDTSRNHLAGPLSSIQAIRYNHKANVKL